jgi:hypothetical protein
MRASRRPRTTALSRLLRGRRPDRNPLRRGSDRAETAMVGVLLAAFLACAPFAANAAASWTSAASTREAQAQQAAIHEVQATLLQAATPWSATVGGSEALARWRAPDGQMRTEQLIVMPGLLAGSTVPVWTNQAGQLTDPPLEHSQVVGRADMSRALAVAVVAVALIFAGWLGRRVLDGRRLAAWDADWLATGPRWTSRR